MQTNQNIQQLITIINTRFEFIKDQHDYLQKEIANLVAIVDPNHPVQLDLF